MLFDTNEHLQKIYLKGEISNFKRHSSGHLYLTLKDDASRINAVMFKSSAAKLTFNPEDGQNVLVEGRVSVLAMLCDVKSDHFILLINTKFCKDADDADTDQRTDNCDSNRYKNTYELCSEKFCLAKYKSIPPGNRINGALSEQAGCNTAPDTADAVASECVQRVIDFQFVFDEIHHKITDRTDQSTDNKG